MHLTSFLACAGGAAAPMDPARTASRADRAVTGGFLPPPEQMRAYLAVFRFVPAPRAELSPRAGTFSFYLYVWPAGQM